MVRPAAALATQTADATLTVVGAPFQSQDVARHHAQLAELRLGP